MIICIVIQVCHASENLTKQPLHGAKAQSKFNSSQYHARPCVQKNFGPLRELTSAKSHGTNNTLDARHYQCGGYRVIPGICAQLYIRIHRTKHSAHEIRISRTICRTTANPRHRDDLTTQVMNNRRKPRAPLSLL